MLHEGQMVLVVEVQGSPVLMIGAGALIPENWLGQEVSVVVEKKDEGN